MNRTAESLLGCSIEIFIEETTWRRAIVSTISTSSGLHGVLVFEGGNAKLCALDMTKQIFHITEKLRGAKKGEVVHGPLISDEFLVAQSVLSVGFGCQEIGHTTIGHQGKLWSIIPSNF
jgi:hypothetical protein